MRIFAFLLLLGFSTQANAASSGFRYDAQSGQCLNTEGKHGYNDSQSIFFSAALPAGNISAEIGLNVKTVIENVDAECVDFSGTSEFASLLPAAVSPSPQTLIKILNAKGAKMTGLSVGNLTIDHALFEGAEFSEMSCIYSSIGFSIDRFSSVPPIGRPWFQKVDLEKKRGVWRDSYIGSLDGFCTTNSFFR